MADAVLRTWTTERSDIEAVRAAFVRPDVARQAWSPVTNDAEARAWLQRRIEQVERDVSLAIDIGGTPVGGVRLSSIHHGQRTGWIGYWLAFEARGRGLASRATASLASWAFDELALERIDLSHRVNNPESGAVAHRAGFVLEGIQRSKLLHDGVRYDIAMHGRLAADPAPELTLLPIVSLV